MIKQIGTFYNRKYIDEIMQEVEMEIWKDVENQTPGERRRQIVHCFNYFREKMGIKND